MRELRKVFLGEEIELDPLEITTEDDGSKYIHDHVTYFFDVISYGIICSLDQRDKERYFKMITDHEQMITKLYGYSILNSKIFLPVAVRNGVNNELIEEYKTWVANK
jgi:hypothetical protein